MLKATVKRKKKKTVQDYNQKSGKLNGKKKKHGNVCVQIN